MAGSYRLTKLLGSGSAGAVYLGIHPVIGTPVAVKVLHHEITTLTNVLDRFIEEARNAARIGSSNIPRYYDFGVLLNGQPYAILEHFEGETAADRLRRCGPLAIEDVADILRQAVRALAAAHDAGIVHRDIKPENLFLVRDADRDRPTVKVLDFGIAKLLEPPPDAARTSFGILVGTPLYCAPEQVGGRTIGPAADIYALGATAFELLGGRPPFIGDIDDVLEAKTKTEPPRIRVLRPDLPAAVEAVLARMLARDVVDRFATMRDVETAIAGWSAQPKPAHVVRRSSRVPALAVMIAAALAIAIAARFVLDEPERVATPAFEIAAQPGESELPITAEVRQQMPAANPPTLPAPATRPLPPRATKPRPARRVPSAEPSHDHGRLGDAILANPFER
jgi:serine/threonine-protein kinase